MHVVRRVWSQFVVSDFEARLSELHRLDYDGDDDGDDGDGGDGGGGVQETTIPVPVEHSTTALFVPVHLAHVNNDNKTTTPLCISTSVTSNLLLPRIFGVAPWVDASTASRWAPTSPALRWLVRWWASVLVVALIVLRVVYVSVCEDVRPDYASVSSALYSAAMLIFFLAAQRTSCVFLPRVVDWALWCLFVLHRPRVGGSASQPRTQVPKLKSSSSHGQLNVMAPSEPQRVFFPSPAAPTEQLSTPDSLLREVQDAFAARFARRMHHMSGASWLLVAGTMMLFVTQRAVALGVSGSVEDSGTFTRPACDRAIADAVGGEAVLVVLFTLSEGFIYGPLLSAGLCLGGVLVVAGMLITHMAGDYDALVAALKKHMPRRELSVSEMQMIGADRHVASDAPVLALMHDVSRHSLRDLQSFGAQSASRLVLPPTPVPSGPPTNGKMESMHRRAGLVLGAAAEVRVIAELVKRTRVVIMLLFKFPLPMILLLLLTAQRVATFTVSLWSRGDLLLGTSFEIFINVMVVIFFAVCFAVGTRVWRTVRVLELQLSRKLEELQPVVKAYSRFSPQAVRTSHAVLANTCGSSSNEHVFGDTEPFLANFVPVFGRLLAMSVAVGLLTAGWGALNTELRYPSCAKLSFSDGDVLKVDFSDCSDETVDRQRYFAAVFSIPFLLLAPLSSLCMFGRRVMRKVVLLSIPVALIGAASLYWFLAAYPSSQELGTSRLLTIGIMSTISLGTFGFLWYNHSERGTGTGIARKFLLWSISTAALTFASGGTSMMLLSVFVSLSSPAQFAFALIVFPVFALAVRLVFVFVLQRLDQYSGNYRKLHVYLYMGVYVFFSIVSRSFITSSSLLDQSLAVLIWSALEVGTRSLAAHAYYVTALPIPYISKATKRRLFLQGEHSRGEPFHRLRIYARQFAEQAGIIGATVLALVWSETYEGANPAITVERMAASATIQLVGEILSDILATKIEHSYLQRHVMQIWRLHDVKMASIGLLFGLVALSAFPGELSQLSKV